jgi:hypothetical protein
MKKISMALVVTQPAKWIMPEIIDHFGKLVKKVRGNVINLQGISQRDVEKFLKSKGLNVGQYFFQTENVPRFPILKMILSEKDIKRESNRFIRTLVIGALKSLREASKLSSDAQLKSIVGVLESWIKSTYKPKPS